MASNSHRTKSSDGTRRFLAFLLFGFIVLSSLSLVGKQQAMNTDKMIECFTSYDYVSGVRAQAIEYASDKYTKNGLSTDNIESIITYDAVKDSIKGYMASQLQAKRGYSQEVELEILEQIYNAFDKDIKAQLDIQGIKYKDDDVKSVNNKIDNFIKSLIELKGSEYFKTITNIGPIVFTVASIVSLVFTALIGVALVFSGKTRYRSLRYISISFISAGLFDLALVIMLAIINRVKTIDIYPIYLQNALYSFIDNVVINIAISAGVLIAISVVSSTVVWKIKRKDL